MIDTEKCCLVVVDVQGKLAQLMVDKESLFANIEVLIKAAKALEIPIVWCQQNPRALGPTVPQLAELLGGVEPVDKMSFSCCGDAGFIDKLNALQAADVILCGIEAHVCIYQTAMDMLDRDLNVHLIADAVSSRTAANRQIGIRRLTAEGANLSCTEMIIFELLKTAEHPEFRRLCGLIK